MGYQSTARSLDLASVSALHHTVRLRTHTCLEFFDLTESVAQLVNDSGIRNGFVNVQTRHTTTAILINENEPLLLEDMRRILEQLAPQSKSYGHDDFQVRTVNLTPDEKPNGHSHCKALFLKSSETINLLDGRLQLGQWQRIFFLELDCARNREISVMILGL